MGTFEVGLNAFCFMLSLQACGGQGVEYSLSIIASLKLIGNGTIGRRGFVGVGMALLEEVYHSGGGL